MKVLISYLRDYFRGLNMYAFLLVSFLVAILIIINYTAGIENNIMAISHWPLRGFGFFLLFTFIFCATWFLQGLFSSSTIQTNPAFYILLLTAPVIFAAKVTFNWFSLLLTKDMLYPWNQYWNLVLGWPLKSVLVLILITITWYFGRYERPVAGMRVKGFPVKPYFIILICLVPLIAFAATRPDFLHMYPKVQRITFIDGYVQQRFPWKLLYEIAYGTDFFTIELFFRGFLILAFIKYAGKDAILPMAAFYCSIHFGKPLFECITSYFGGIALGAIVYHTRSIWGGLIVHLGIAWLMEVAGYFGHG